MQCDAPTGAERTAHRRGRGRVPLLFTAVERRLEQRPVWLAALAVLLLLPCVACGSAVGGNWWRSGNDMGYFLRELERTSPGEVLGWLTGPWIGHELFRYYRPVTSLAIYAEYAVFGRHSAGWQALSLLLHLGSTLCLALLCRRVLRSPTAALVAASVWTLRPRMAMTIEWVPAQTDLLAGFFALLSLLALQVYLDERRRRWLLLAALSLVLAMGSKEVALVVPGMAALLILHARGVAPRRKALLIGGAVLLIVTFVAWRSYALAGLGYVPGAEDMPARGASEQGTRLALRLLDFLLPAPSLQQALPSVLLIFIATGVALLLWVPLRQRNWTHSFIVGGVGLIGLTLAAEDDGWWLLPENLVGLALGVGALLLVLLVVRRCPRQALLLAGWGVVAWLPTYQVVYNVAGNVRYLPDTYWALGWGTLAIALLAPVSTAGQRSKSSAPCVGETPPAAAPAASAAQSELSAH